MLDQLNTAAASLGGNWRKLRTTEDGAIEGRVLSFEDREKSFEGAVVLNRKTGQPRREWVFTLEVDGEDEPIKIALNESGQRAVAAALREAGVKAKEGDTLKIGVKTDPPSDREQAEYQARWTPAAPALGVPAADADPGDPF